MTGGDAAKDAPTHGAARRPWFGVAIVIFAAMGFALSVMLARVVYRSGGSPASIIGVRLTTVFIALSLYCWLTKTSVRLPPRVRGTALALGVLIAFQTLSIYASFKYIPVSLSVLIEYFYPLLVAIAMRLVAGEPLTAVKIGCIGTAVLGLTLILKVSFDDLDAYGIFLAGLSAAALTVIITTSNQLLRGIDSLRLMLHMQGAGAVASLTVFSITGDLVLPTTPEGLAAVFAIPLFNGSALFAVFTAIGMIGATKVSLSLTSEPIFVVALAVIFLGETLVFTQAVGAILIVGAIFVMQLWGAPRAGAAR
ncbi:MAG: DMT family transporter [Alphaproteobacteria bacterium]